MSVEFRNVRMVHEDNLIRSGQMTPEGFRRFVREQGIQTVISLRDRKDEDGQHEDQEEKDYCDAHGLAFYRLPPADWTQVNGVAPADKNIEEFLRILDDPKTKRPVLVHCFAGIHRTGAYCAIWRMDQQAWTNEQAMREMVNLGYDILDEHKDLKAFLHQYRSPVKETGLFDGSRLIPVRVHGGIGP